MRQVVFSSLFVILLIGQSFAAASAEKGAARLRVIIEGVEPAAADVSVGLFDKDSFLSQVPGRGPIASATLVANNHTLIYEFSGLRYGNYAVSAFYDGNRNHVLDTNLLGIPSEAYGFSNNARKAFGPPSFSEAKIIVQDVHVDVRLRLKQHL